MVRCTITSCTASLEATKQAYLYPLHRAFYPYFTGKILALCLYSYNSLNGDDLFKTVTPPRVAAVLRLFRAVLCPRMTPKNEMNETE